MLRTVELETGTPVAASVVWLHGLGADAHDFEPIVPELELSQTHLRFVFPHAPVRPVTLNGGMPMRAWYDIKEPGLVARQDDGGIRESAARVRELIERECDRGVGADRIVLAGFSQGGAIALHCGLRHPARLAGILALSTYLPLQGTLDDEAAEANRGTPLFLAHGMMDPVVNPDLGIRTREFLRQRDYAVEWRSYPMGHAVCAEQVADIRAWMSAILDCPAIPHGDSHL